jgi:hypothetical protein
VRYLDTVGQWLNNLNLLEVGLTTLLTSWMTARNSKRDMLKGIQVTERIRSEIISEVRGQIDSIRKKQ